MTASDVTEITPLAPLTDLLLAHARLISETSETLALDLAEGLLDLRDRLPESPESKECQNSGLRHRAEQLFGLLQTQDILRQQVDVLLKGLTALAEAEPPAGADPVKWREACLSDIEKTYVMQSQHDLHAKALGRPVVSHQPTEADIFF